MFRAVLLVALFSVPALARQPEAHTPVVLSREATQARLNRLSDLLSESIGQSKGATKKKLEKAREEVRALQAELAEAPTSKIVEESTRASVGMMGDIMQMGRDQMENDRREHHTKVVVVKHQEVPAAPPAPPAPPPVKAMSDGAFKQLVGSVQREGFDDGKLQVVTTAAKANHFRVEQVGQLLRQFPFSDGKLSAARALKPRILDMENAYQLYGVMDFENDKEQLKAILAE